ncbi:hypothetical protein TWF281_010986 [Arthrobotrys megalospora]
MEGKYQTSLEALKPDERELIIHALKWAVWGVDTVSTLEIIEHYKQIYHSNTPYNPSSDPEIADTKHCLYGAGRDFFQFDTVSDTINVRPSVKDWVEDQAKLFTAPKDGNVAENNQILSELEDKRGAHLTIATEILYALNNRKFQDRYRPWNPPTNLTYNKLWDKPWHKDQDGEDLEQVVQPSSTSDPTNQSDPKVDALKFSSKRVRYEINHWGEHLRLLQEEWQPEERKGTQWDKFWEQFRILIKPQNWKRWGNLMTCREFDIDDWSEPHQDLYTGFETPIGAAADLGLVFILDYVVENGIATVKDLNGQVDGVDFQPMNQAVREPKFIQALLHHGADVDIVSKYGDTPLELALLLYQLRSSYELAQKDHLETAKILIQAGAKLKPDNSTPGCKSFLFATSFRDIDLFHLIFSKVDKDEVNKPDTDGNTAMHHLFSGDDGGQYMEGEREDKELKEYSDAGREIFDLLLQGGADINARNSKGETPLLCAAYERDLDGIKLLLENGADVQSTDNNGDTCFHKILNTEGVFSKTDPAVIAKVLSEAGLDATQKNNDGKTTLSIAVENQDAPLFRYVLDFYREQYPSSHEYLLQKDTSSRNLLYQNATNRDSGVEIAKLIVEELSEEEVSACLSLSDSEQGLNPLHVAAQSLNFEMLDYLLSLKADVMAKTLDGKTALDILIEEIPSAFASAGMFALEETETRCEKCLSLLISANPELGSNLQALTHAAIRSGSKRILEFSLKGNTNPLDSSDDDGWTLFHSALYSGAKDLLRDCLPSYSHDTAYDSLSESRRPTQLSKTRKGTWCKTSEDGLEIWQGDDCPADKVQAILSDYPIPAEVDRYYFEVTVQKVDSEQITSPCVGFQSPRASDYERRIGLSHGIGFDGKTGHILINRTGEPTIQLKTFNDKHSEFGQGTANDTVGCGFDIKTGNVFFTLNGEYLGVGGMMPKHSKYYPAVSVGDKNCHLSVNFGSEPFLFKSPHESFAVLGT